MVHRHHFVVFMCALASFCVFLRYSESTPSLSGSASLLVSAARVRQISWRPRVFIYEGFLTAEECDHVISLAKTELKRSTVADDVSGESKLSDARTSSGTFIDKGKDSIISRIEDKIAAWTFLPKGNGEDIQVLRYEYGQKYDPHYDYFTDKVNIAHGGNRLATVLMYLSDVEQGGETVFPFAANAHTKRHFRNIILSDCTRRGIAVKPRKGDALLFFSMHPNATLDDSSLHGGCPVIKGEKWSATKWIHVGLFNKNVSISDTCGDSHINCEQWAALGECTGNKEYMVGTSEVPGFCQKSCNVC